MTDLLQKLAFIKERYDEVGKQIIDPEIIADMKRYVKLNKELFERNRWSIIEYSLILLHQSKSRIRHSRRLVELNRSQ